MSKQTPGSLAIVGVIASGVFLVAFVALMVIGGYTFSPAAFLALLVAGVAGLAMFWAFHDKATAPDHAAAQQTAAGSAHAAPPPAAGHDAPAPHQAPEPHEPPAVEADAPPPSAEAADTPPPVAQSAQAIRPARLDAPDGEPDDLKKIKGVGPKLERLLHSMGFYHYHQVAAWTADEVAWVDDNLEGFKGRVSRDDWVAQAKILAAGGETEFSRRAG